MKERWLINGEKKKTLVVASKIQEGELLDWFLSVLWVDQSTSIQTPISERNEMSKPEEKIIFAISQDHENQTLLVMLGIPTAAWEYMKDGKTHTFDLQKAGLPVRLVLFGGRDLESIMKILKEDLQKQGIKVNDQRGKDFSIGG